MTPRVSRRRVVGAIGLVGLAAAPMGGEADGAFLLVAPQVAGRLKGRKVRVLDGDPVRQIRALLLSSDRPIHGVTRWSDQVIARGLAREFRRGFAPAGRNGDVFIWTIHAKET